jgi:hypothetical protein
MLAGMRAEICPLAAQKEPSETVDRPRSVPTTELWARPVTAVRRGHLPQRRSDNNGPDSDILHFGRPVPGAGWSANADMRLPEEQR